MAVQVYINICMYIYPGAHKPHIAGQGATNSGSHQVYYSGPQQVYYSGSHQVYYSGPQHLLTNDHASKCNSRHAVTTVYAWCGLVMLALEVVVTTTIVAILTIYHVIIIDTPCQTSRGLCAPGIYPRNK